jgi:hypothetical protein
MPHGQQPLDVGLTRDNGGLARSRRDQSSSRGRLGAGGDESDAARHLLSVDVHGFVKLKTGVRSGHGKIKILKNYKPLCDPPEISIENFQKKK